MMGGGEEGELMMVATWFLIKMIYHNDIVHKQIISVY